MIDYSIPITFDKDKRTFSGKKHDYQILESLPVCRYKEVGIIETELAFGGDPNAIAMFAKGVFDNINNGKNNSANVALDAHRLMSNMQDISGRTQAIFKFMDIYTVRKTDNPSQELESFGGQHLKEKMEDWALIDTNFFLAVAMRLIPNYLKTLEQLSQSISGEIQTKK